MIVVGAVWIGLAVVVAFGIGRAVRIAEAREARSASAEDTNAAGEGRHLHLVASCV